MVLLILLFVAQIPLVYLAVGYPSLYSHVMHHYFMQRSTSYFYILIYRYTT